jgi:hypothetical protein
MWENTPWVSLQYFHLKKILASLCSLLKPTDKVTQKDKSKGFQELTWIKETQEIFL